MCTIDHEYMYTHVYIIFEHSINLTPWPSSLYAKLNTKILWRNAKGEEKEPVWKQPFQAPFPEL